MKGTPISGAQTEIAPAALSDGGHLHSRLAPPSSYSTASQQPAGTIRTLPAEDEGALLAVTPLAETLAKSCLEILLAQQPRRALVVNPLP